MFEIHFFSDFENLTCETLSLWAESLPCDVRKTAERYKKEDDRKKSLICYHLLREALMKDYGIADFGFCLSENGKPYLKERNDIFFNTSHCRNGCICVVSDNEIGADIQDIRPFSQRLAEKVCSYDELIRIENSSDKAREFAKIWAMKESFIKMTGDGFSYGLKKAVTDESRFFITEKNDSFIAVCEKKAFLL